MKRLSLLRRHSVFASPVLLRRRGLRVVTLGWWLLVYVPRGHWSNHL